MLVNVVVDAASPAHLAEFWSEMLSGWFVREEPEGEVDVVAPSADGATLDLVFVPVASPKRGKNRVHLDLASNGPEHQAELVDRALTAGATHVDIGQGDVPWVVLADPEGNEFCVLEHRAVYAGSGRLASIVMDTPDPAALAPFWATATGWEVVRAEPRFASLRAPDGRGPWLELLRTNDPKVGKNRVHLDVRGVEVERLVGLGAGRVDVGQGDVPWAVLEDPQGNEFCIL
ncbi:VOC family protein [Labedaea rhizosphaerae]|nr:VOC family protein [Labedaea rhizosphaerae]